MPRKASRGTFSKILGSAFAEGLAQYNAGHPGAAESAAGHAQADIAELQQLGIEIPDYLQETADRLPGRAAKGVKNYVERDPLPPSWRKVHVEQPFGEENARPDLVCDDGAGLIIVDYKCKLTLDSKRDQWVRRDYEHHWQMLHYCWRTGAKRYLVVICVLEPRFRVLFAPGDGPVEVTDEDVAFFEQSGQRWWDQMDREDEGAHPIVGATTHQFYGEPCDYQQACFDYRLDEALMAQSYVKRERK